jgi:hypothetical protein
MIISLHYFTLNVDLYDKISDQGDYRKIMNYQAYVIIRHPFFTMHVQIPMRNLIGRKHISLMPAYAG